MHNIQENKPISLSFRSFEKRENEEFWLIHFLFYILRVMLKLVFPASSWKFQIVSRRKATRLFRRRLYVRSKRSCERVSERDITRIRASYVFQAEGRREGRKGRRGSRVGAGGWRGQRGIITDDCPLLRHGQSTARNPVHSAGSSTRNDDSRWRSAMCLAWTAKERGEG